MRIAMLSWETLHSIAVGGVAQHVTELSAALAQGPRGPRLHPPRPGQAAHEQIDGVAYHRYFYPSHHEFVDDVNNMCRTFIDAVFEIEDLVGHFDVVHAHDWLTANAMIWIKQGRRHAGILTVHSTEYARCGNVFHGGRSARIRDQERAGTYWADQVICVSHATRAEIQWMYEVPEWKTHTVYNGVSPHRFDFDVDAGSVKRGYAIGPVDPTVLFCGRLEHQKGPDLLVEAVPAVLRTQPRPSSSLPATAACGGNSKAGPGNSASLTPAGFWATATAANSLPCSRWPMRCASPAATSRSASWSSRPGAPASRSSSRRTAARTSTCTTRKRA